MIATTIEQSKHLVELGVDINSSDMTYWEKLDGYVLVPRNFSYGGFSHIPAWSLSALFSLLLIDCKLEKTLLDQSDYFTYSCVWTDEYRTMEYENPIDAVYEMLCYIKENYE